MAYATRRTFASVKSSAITPRQPSVPNRISLTREKVYAMAGATRRRRATRASDDQENSQPGSARRVGLKQFAAFALFEPFHDLADVLRTLSRADQQRVPCFDDDEVANSYC